MDYEQFRVIEGATRMELGIFEESSIATSSSIIEGDEYDPTTRANWWTLERDFDASDE
jgi:hypothetical protein